MTRRSESKPRPFAVGEEPSPAPVGRLGANAGGKRGDEGFTGTKNANRRKAVAKAKKQRDFTTFALRNLRRAEIAVWLAIFNCEHGGQAQIGQERIKELTKVSKRHIGKAIASLVKRGLLEVIAQGRFRPGKNKGLTSVYVIHGLPKVPAG